MIIIWESIEQTDLLMVIILFIIIIIMNLEYALNDSYQAYSHIEIHKLKDRNVWIILPKFFIVIGYNSSENDFSAIIITKQRAN